MRYTLITHEKYKKVPQVIEDYIFSLNIISSFEPLNKLEDIHDRDDEEMFIISQIILTNDYLDNIPEHIANSNKITFLNVEMLSESTRMQRIINIIDKTNFKIADYSIENIKLLLFFCHKNNINITNKVIYLPYQFNLKENQNLSNLNDEYDYDIGIINAIPEKNDTVNKELDYRRENIWNDLQKFNSILHNKYKIINIKGWGEERDKIISRCKIILNIHHFECYNIHESIRCDRLVFAKKILISDFSYFTADLDLSEYFKPEKYEDIIKTTFDYLGNFDTINNNFKKLDMGEIISKRKNILSDEIKKLENINFYTYEDMINYGNNDKTDVLIINNIHNKDNKNIIALKKTTFEIDFTKTGSDFYNPNEYENCFNCIFLNDLPDVKNLVKQFNNSITMLRDKGDIFINNVYSSSTDNETWKFIYYILMCHKNDIKFETYKLLNNTSLIKINIKNTFIIEESMDSKIKNVSINENYLNFLVSSLVNIS